ncbi:MAG: phosphonate metabolism protein [Rhodobacteraceae bacterium]|jgi:putative phosphonate metabolism protein|uniref:Putative phosphonate metabolism protein n=1 Tax=Salipiger profundus TaxID=1229727 RepID=A0A1U7DBZ0_9RHOB|nr:MULTISPECIES: DUF1045 domain-containing protein [Salipiger]APX25697.1 putative phosphonate metabolism protein [Salipiger profundus]MAB06374.1 phosphonate metabolism protein [Paracoccaceae bacterium]GGA03996.1 phosphonate metabolism protein [Salipiger profundus]SFD55837.1 putative phosphonate metabolism protein [Salipiger profundus]
MTDYSRFAVYHAPAPGPLATFCAGWLGHDPVTGQTCPHPEIPGLPRPVDEITATPRKYGFHGTLKPPFRLTGPRGALEADLAALAARLSPVEMPGLSLTRLGSFLALTPEGDTAPLAQLAAQVVRSLDGHRQPPQPAELERRRQARLTPRQEENLLRWGYPYVMDDFRFHLTLTGKLSRAEAEQTAEALRPVLAPLLPRPFRVDALCLFGEAADGRFHQLARYPLGG